MLDALATQLRAVGAPADLLLPNRGRLAPPASMCFACPACGRARTHRPAVAMAGRGHAGGRWRAPACSTTTTATTGDAGATAATTAPVAAGPAVPSTGCASTPQAGPVTSQHDTIDVGGSSRWYLLDTPAPDTPSPTRARSPSSPPRPGQRAPTPAPRRRLPRTGRRGGHPLGHLPVRVAGPGRTGSYSSPQRARAARCSGTPPTSRRPTPTSSTSPPCSIQARVDPVHRHVTRVYASGFSDGSFMVSLLACTRSNRFAAIAAVSGLQAPEALSHHPPGAHPLVSRHGRSHPVLQRRHRNVHPQHVDRWGTVVVRPVPPPRPPCPRPSSTVPATRPPSRPGRSRTGAIPTPPTPRSRARSYGRTYRCPVGTEHVEFYIILGGGHAWPGSSVSQAISRLTGFTTFQISATPGHLGLLPPVHAVSRAAAASPRRPRPRPTDPPRDPHTSPGWPNQWDVCH